MTNAELVRIVKGFAVSGRGTLSASSKKWLDNVSIETRKELIEAIEQADEECGKCGCEFDALYKRALGSLRAM